MKNTDLAKKMNVTPQALCKLQKSIREKGWGTDAQRKLAEAQGKIIIAIDKPK